MRQGELEKAPSGWYDSRTDDTMNRAPALLALAALCSCAHGERESRPWAPLKLNTCLPRAMHAALAVPRGAPNEQNLAVYFRNYAEAFLDAREQQRYLDCLETQKDAPDSAALIRDARRWLGSARDQMARSMRFFPKERRIVDAREEFIRSADGARATRRLAVTQKDGTRTVFEDEVPAAP